MNRQFERSRRGISILLGGFLIACQTEVGEPATSAPLDSNKVDPNDHWSALTREVESGEFRSITSVFALRGRCLEFEGYFGGTDAEHLHDTRSVGKTFASAILGLALADGHLYTLEQTLEEFYASPYLRQSDERKRATTLRELITMSSAFEGDDSDPASPGNEENMYDKEDWVAWTLKLPMRANDPRVVEWRYFTAGVVLLGDVLDKSVPGGLEVYAQQRLFEPLGIVKYAWSRTPQGKPSTAGGLRLRTRDLAKFGQLYRDQGNYRARKVLTRSWVQTSTSKHVSTSTLGTDYGYLWWRKNYRIGGKSYESFFASGNGGNKIFVFPGLDAVVVVTATAYGQAFAHPQVDRMVSTRILPGLVEGQAVLGTGACTEF